MTAVDDFTGKVVLTGLTPDTRYLYWVRFVSESEQVVSEPGQFRTAPADGVARAVTLVWWGDLGGQAYCRDPERGYALFREMARLAPDLAVANGDSIYADSTCPPVTALPDHPRNVVSADPDAALHQLVDASDPRLATEAEVLAAYRGKWKIRRGRASRTSACSGSVPTGCSRWRSVASMERWQRMIADAWAR